MTVYDDYLEQHKLTRYRLAEKSGVTRSTLQTAGDATQLSQISTKIMMATADVLEITPGQVLDELENMFSHKNNYSLNQMSQSAKRFIDNRPGTELVELKKFDKYHIIKFKYLIYDNKKRSINIEIKKLDDGRGKITDTFHGYAFSFTAASLKSADTYKTQAQIMTCIESIIAADCM